MQDTTFFHLGNQKHNVGLCKLVVLGSGNMTAGTLLRRKVDKTGHVRLFLLSPMLAVGNLVNQKEMLFG